MTERSAERMSLRAMAAVAKCSPSTILRDFQSQPGYAPDEDGMIEVDKVRGLDGKVRLSRRIDTTARDAQIRELHEAGQSIRAIAAEVGCSVGTVHRIVAMG